MTSVDSDAFRRFAEQPDPPAPPGPLAARIITGLVLALTNLAGLGFAAFSWTIQTAASWRFDANSPAAAGIFAVIAFGAAIVGGLLTLVAVKLRWAGRWWYAGPALVALVACTAGVGVNLNFD